MREGRCGWVLVGWIDGRMGGGTDSDVAVTVARKRGRGMRRGVESLMVVCVL